MHKRAVATFCQQVCSLLSTPHEYVQPMNARLQEDSSKGPMFRFEETLQVAGLDIRNGVARLMFLIGTWLASNLLKRSFS
jgi:hypothetical protein